jgi:hypothetical protein
VVGIVAIVAKEFATTQHVEDERFFGGIHGSGTEAKRREGRHGKKAEGLKG